MTIIAAPKKLTRVVAALAIAAAALPAGAQAASDTVDASASFTTGGLNITAPASSVDFGSTQLDGRASYDLTGDIGDWRVTDATGTRAGWVVTVEATNPKAADDDTEATAAVMKMTAGMPNGVGPAPSVNAASLKINTPGGAQFVTADAGQGVGQWNVLQAGTGDMSLVMPYDTHATQYDSTLTFTTAQSISW